MRRRSLLGLFTRNSRRGSERERRETAAKVGAGIRAAALAALFLGVRHYKANTATAMLAQLLAVLRDVTIEEGPKRNALLAAKVRQRSASA